MAKHFRITLRVAYENGTIPGNMREQLERRLKARDMSDLFDDDSGESIVEDWSVDVEDAGTMPSVPCEPMKV